MSEGEPAGGKSATPMTTVVGVAVIEHGRLLAARRTRPSSMRGRWELPGGKVEPDETPSAAAVREVREELGCRIEVLAWLAGCEPVASDDRLRVALARGEEGEPIPHEHDAIRWLAPEQLDTVPWLEPDLPFLPTLRETLLDGEPMTGGNVGGAVRIGRTVRRGTGPWTPAVHRLLGHVHAKRLRAVPRVLGVDERNREVLSYLPGRIVDVDHEMLTDAQLGDLARWTRQLHDAVEDFTGETASGPWRFFPVPGADIVAHNDIAPYNVCFNDDRVAGVFDWDMAGPSTRVFELAHLAWNCVPLYGPIPADQAARRLELVAAAYGGPSAAEILTAVIPLKRIGAAGIRDWIAKEDPAGAAQAAVGEPALTERAVADLATRMPAIIAHLPRP